MMAAGSLPDMSASTTCIGQKVLLIDDDELIAGSLRQYLAMQGCDGACSISPPPMLQPDASGIVVTGYGTNDLAQMATARIPLLTKPQSVVTLSDFQFKGLST
jgi:hypothetical protein